jgi:cell wall-associated NlpC family hydrolase
VRLLSRPLAYAARVPPLKRPPEPDDVNRVRRRALTALAAVAAACVIAVAVALASSGGNPHNAATAAAAPTPRPPVPEAVATPQDAEPLPPLPKARPKVVQALGPGELPPEASSTNSAPPSDAEVRAELTAFRKHLNGFSGPTGPVPKVLPDGTAVAPANAPAVVKAVIAAGNEVATKPYKWGGGHGAWRDSGYDCSGSVSFALAGAGLLDAPLASGGFLTYGASGPGRWITLYTNPGHMFMVVAGLRFDTSGAAGGTRWQPVDGRSYGGFTVRHPPGL